MSDQVPQSMQTIQTVNKLVRVVRGLIGRLDREPTVEEIATAMDMAPAQVTGLLQLSQTAVANAPPSTPLPQEALVRQVRDDVEDVLASMTEEEGRVLRLRFGLGDGPIRSVDEVSKECGVPPERIQEIEAKALRELGGPIGSGLLNVMRSNREGAGGPQEIEADAAVRRLGRSVDSTFDRFTPRARKTLALAVEEATNLRHGFVGTEHLLLGLLREGTGIAAVVLRDLDMSLAGVRGLVQSITATDAPDGEGERRLTKRAEKAISLAAEEARRMHQRFIGTEHLLLGLVRESDGIAAGVLEAVGVTNLDEIRRRVVRVLASGRRPPDQSRTKSNVVTCRIDDRDLGALDALVEAGIRTTRSDAASWLIRAGIEAHQALFDRVQASVSEIRQLRLEAQLLAQQLPLEERSDDEGGSDEGGEGETS